MHSLLFIFLKFDRANIFAVKKLFQRLSWKITRSLKINYYDIMVVIDTSLLKFILTRIWQRGCKGVTRGFARGGSPQAGREGWSLLLNVRPSFLTLYLLFYLLLSLLSEPPCPCLFLLPKRQNMKRLKTLI